MSILSYYHIRIFVILVLVFFIDVASIPSKRIRGPTRGMGLEKHIRGKNKLVINIPTGKGRLVCEVQSAKLSSEIGVIS